MADAYITGMAAAEPLDGEEFLEVSQLSASVTITAATISAAAADNSYNDSGSGFVAAGFAVDDRVRVQGFTGDVANNILIGTITALTTGKMTIGGTDGDVIVDDAAGESVTISKWVSRRAASQEIADLAAGGSAGWALAGTGQTATGVYDFAVDGAKANIDFVGLAGFSEIRVIAHGIDLAISGLLVLRLSTDNGASFFATSGDYIRISSAGAATNVTGVTLWDASSTDPRSGSATIAAANISGIPKMIESHAQDLDNLMYLFTASTDDVDAVSLIPNGGGNTTAGKIYCLAR